MPSDPRPCFLLIWFGPWPTWMDYFLHSCGKNPDFEWLIFHDSTESVTCPGNVHLLPTRKAEIEQRVSECLKIDFSLSYGYKICDLRPAYGHVFREELSPYTHWGWSDLDQIWGEISRFLTPDRIEEHDILTAATHHLVGHCTLIRNTKRLNLLYRRIPNFNEQLISKDYEALEEKAFDRLSKADAADGKIKIFESRIAEEDCWIRWNGRKRFMIEWKNGKLKDVHTCRTLCYFHFIKSKHRPSFQVTPPKGPLNAFYITRDGIHPRSGLFQNFRFIASTCIGFIATIPFYIKCLAKKILSPGIRARIRRRLS